MSTATLPTSLSLQDSYAPANACFGCGPANAKGLQIKSFAEIDETGREATVCTWQPQKHHEAFDGVLSGGIIGTLLDCHCNWTAAYHLMRHHVDRGVDEAGRGETPPCTVTAEYAIKLLRPTPTSGPLTLRAHVVASSEDRAEVEGTLEAGGKVCATCRGVFVAVKPGHPAYHRW